MTEERTMPSICYNDKALVLHGSPFASMMKEQRRQSWHGSTFTSIEREKEQRRQSWSWSYTYSVSLKWFAIYVVDKRIAPIVLAWFDIYVGAEYSNAVSHFTNAIIPNHQLMYAQTQTQTQSRSRLIDVSFFIIDFLSIHHCTHNYFFL